MLTFSSPSHNQSVMYSIFHSVYIIFLLYFHQKSLFADILHLDLTLSLKWSYNHWPAFIVHYVKSKLQKEDYFSLRVVWRH